MSIDKRQELNEIDTNVMPVKKHQWVGDVLVAQSKDDNKWAIFFPSGRSDSLANKAEGLKRAKDFNSALKTARRNPSQPHRRVRRALKKYVKKELAGLPTQYTPAKVRVDSKGEIDIKFARPPKGSTRNPKRFKVTRKR